MFCKIVVLKKTVHVGGYVLVDGVTLIYYIVIDMMSQRSQKILSLVKKQNNEGKFVFNMSTSNIGI